MRTFDRNTLLYTKNTFIRKCFSTFAVSFIHIKKLTIMTSGKLFNGCLIVLGIFVAIVF